MPGQFQRRQVGLALAQQVQRQQPCGQRQLGVVEHRARSQAGLVAAGRTLPVRLLTTVELAVLRDLAAGACKALWPTRLLQCLLALPRCHSAAGMPVTTGRGWNWTRFMAMIGFPQSLEASVTPTHRARRDLAEGSC